MSSIFFVIGGSLFGVLGLMHAFLTYADISNPKRLVPDDPTVTKLMASSNVHLSRGGTTMWRAWVGFNFSHSLGLVMFGFGCLAIGLSLDSLALPKAALLMPSLVGVIYFWLAVRYWFRAPAIGVALSTIFFIVGWLIY